MLRLFAASVVLLAGLLGYAKATAVGFDDVNQQIGSRLWSEMRYRYDHSPHDNPIWTQLKQAVAGHTGMSLLIEVNDRINQFKYVTDLDNYGEFDYWATPFELISHGGGDCEDYALAKYFLLLESGVPVKDMWVEVVFSPYGAHAVLVVRLGFNDWYVMDQQTGQIVPSTRNPYQELYLISDAGYRSRLASLAP